MLQQDKDVTHTMLWDSVWDMNLIKLAYNKCQLEGQVPEHPGQHVSSPGNSLGAVVRPHCGTASTQCAYPQMDGPAEFAKLAR